MLIPTTDYSGAGVYVIGPVDDDIEANWKIGVTTNIKDRFKTIQSHSPVELTVKAFEEGSSRDRELEIHKYFKTARIQGEWFQLTDMEKSHLISMLGSRERFGTIAPRKDWEKIPQRTPGSNYTLGVCTLCGRNVQSRSAYFKLDVGKYKHADCERAVSQMKYKKKRPNKKRRRYYDKS